MNQSMVSNNLFTKVEFEESVSPLDRHRVANAWGLDSLWDNKNKDVILDYNLDFLAFVY